MNQTGVESDILKPQITKSNVAAYIKKHKNPVGVAKKVAPTKYVKKVDQEDPFENSEEKKKEKGSQKRTFIHRVLTPWDLLGEIKFSYFSWWYGRKHDSETAEQLAWDSLSEGQVIFKKGIELFEDDICIESLLRCVNKLQSAVATLMEYNEEAAYNAKVMYFSNQIIYQNKKYDENLRYSNTFLNFLRHTVAETISYDTANGGEFSITSKAK